MRSSIVLTLFLSLPVLEGTHERVILLFEFPILEFSVVIFLRFRVLVFRFEVIFWCAYVCAGRVITLSFILIPILPRYVTLHLRIANHMVMDSCCRGGIVHSRCGCSCAQNIRRPRPTALWRFRASTSNNPSGRAWLHFHTPMRYIDHTYARQDIRVCEDDHLKPPKWQCPNPKALWLLRVSI